MDLRKYFIDKKSGDLLPSRKGIALNESGIATLRQVLEERRDEIADWFNEDPVKHNIRKNLTLAEKATRNAISSPKNTVSTAECWKSPAFFRAEHEGGTTKVYINEAHPFGKKLLQLISDPQDLPGKTLILSLLEGFARAKHLYDGENSGVAEVILDALLVNWGLILQRD